MAFYHSDQITQITHIILGFPNTYKCIKMYCHKNIIQRYNYSIFECIWDVKGIQKLTNYPLDVKLVLDRPKIK